MKERQENYNGKDNLLAQGRESNGKAIAGWVIFYLASAIVSFVLAYNFGYSPEEIFIQNRYGLIVDRYTVNTPNAFLFIFIGIGIVELLFAPLTANAIAETYIKVYNDCVVGRGISKWFYFGDLRKFDFMLPIEQTTISVNGGQMIVHGPGSHYKVYVRNAAKIQSLVHELKTVKMSNRGLPYNNMANNTATAYNNVPNPKKGNPSYPRNNPTYNRSIPPNNAPEQIHSTAHNSIIMCISCGIKNQSDSRFCINCGNAFVV